ncbi:hypothetical protein DEO23_05485 [Brachybacterium endophyticum]|uniref:STAS domain-containing protein n=1 Tax=Brachybacterium endophyticum TaxID=2182385 RepID=A0A2U2RKW9_9MICO|nr:SpoIIE family protein phosphatase [Brachybacterium endophyticum]PWH06424.1 hypothetical protein DEO23_05485 [Brachybacterium endophyticum]
MSQPGVDGDLDGRVGELRAVRAGFDDLPMPVVLVEGPDHRLVAANAAFRRFSGWQHPIGRTLREIFPGPRGQLLLEIVEKVHATGEPVTADEWRQQAGATAHATADEDHEFAVIPRKDARGEVCGAVIQQMDVAQRVHERQQAEVDAAEAEERYQEAHGTVVELQRALLPPQLPVLPRVRTAARYLVADRDQAAGGDWFDAIPLGEGRLALVVGDIVGHGVAASAAMGQARAILEDAMVRSHDLRTSIQRVDELAARRTEVRASTVCAAILDVQQGRLDYITCGHPAPLIIGPDGSSRTLPPSGSMPLGTAGPIRVASARIEPDETAFLFSDGLIERAGLTLDEGVGALRDIARAAVLDAGPAEEGAASPAERICQQAVELLARTGYDDITTLAAHVLTRPHVPMSVEAPADVDGLLELRPRLCERVARLGLDTAEVQGLDLAATEVISNVIEHAYLGQDPGSVRIDAAIGEDGFLEFAVSDQGLWVPESAPSPVRGRGLWIAASVMDQVEIARKGTPADRGSRVVLRRRLGRPSNISEPEVSGGTAAPSRTPLELRSENDEPSRLVATGCADIASSADVADHLDRSSRGGFHDLTLDLSGLQLLASSAVRILIDARGRMADHGHEITLVAARGTPARAVLDVVGLPCEPEGTDRPPGAWPS